MYQSREIVRRWPSGYLPADAWIRHAEIQVELWGRVRGRGERYWSAIDELRDLRMQQMITRGWYG